MNPKITELAATTFAVLALLPAPLLADVYWNGSTSSDWSDARNWTGGLPSKPGAGNAIVNPGSPFNAPVVNTQAAPVAGQIYLSISVGLTVAGGGQVATSDLITGSWGNSAPVTVSGGKLKISGTLNVGAGGHDGDVTISGGTVTTSTLSINAAGGAAIDISGTGKLTAAVSQLDNIKHWITNEQITANSKAPGWTVKIDTDSQSGSVILSALFKPLPTPLTSLIPSCDHAGSKDPKHNDCCRAGYQYYVGIVGNPEVPEISWSDEQLKQIKDLGVNMLQLSIAWGGKPADEVLNLEDLDAAQREKFKFRISQAKKHGMQTIAHFGIPRMINFNPVRPACIRDPEVQSKYRDMLREFMTSFPDVNDVLVYTFDQQAWLCSEFGPCPRCSGMPLDERLPDFINMLNETMRSCRPGTRLWWKPWELSKGQVVTILDKIDPKNFGLVLNPSSSNEVYPFNDRSFKSDLGVKRLVRMAYERDIPVLGEFDHTFYKPLYQIEDFFPRLIYEQMLGWKEMQGVVGIKEYYGFAPSTFSVNAAMLKAWVRSPEASLESLLQEIAAPYGAKAAPLVISAWEYVAQSVEAFPWDTTYLIGPMGLHRGSDGSHDWNPVTIPGGTWDTPIWKANRKGNFMLTDEHKAHPWLFEDAGLRLEDSAALAFRAVDFYEQAISAGCDRVDDVRTQLEITRQMALTLRMKSLHFLETLAAQDARMVMHDDKQFAIVTKRLESLLQKDVKNQNGCAEVKQKLAHFQRDPKGWLNTNLCPRDFETTTTLDWSKWVPRQD